MSLLPGGRGRIGTASLVPTAGGAQAKQLKWACALNGTDLKSSRTPTSWHFTTLCAFAEITRLHPSACEIPQAPAEEATPTRHSSGFC